VKNWVLKTEVNGTARKGGNARLPAMTAMLIPGLVLTRYKLLQIERNELGFSDNVGA